LDQWSRRLLWPQMVNVDLSDRFTTFDLPIYFLIGRYDYTTNQGLARSYFDKIKAPLKQFYLFEKSAHSPLFEEPEQAKEILLRDVLAGRKGN
jgi:pimeloyl-ACP methyl ester carboxylesterase